MDDVFLNSVAYWRDVPEKVWDFTIGGYQVMKKWLSYRERTLLGRDLTMDEVDYFTQMARRIAAIILLSEQLDENYRACRDEAYAWESTGTPSGTHVKTTTTEVVGGSAPISAAGQSKTSTKI